MPPDRGYIDPSSAYVRPALSVINPPAVQASSSKAGDGSAAAIVPVVRKIPEPMMLPRTKRTADPRPSARTSPSSGKVVATDAWRTGAATAGTLAHRSGSHNCLIGRLPPDGRQTGRGDRIRTAAMAARLASILVAAIVGTTLIAGLIVGAQRDDNSGPVGLIIHNAKVYAADDLGTIAEAVAIRGNKILKVGGEREVMRYRRPQTAVIDARGAAVLPGFDDAHLSLIAGGLARDGVQLAGAASVDEMQSRVSEWAAAK